MARASCDCSRRCSCSVCARTSLSLLFFAAVSTSLRSRSLDCLCRTLVTLLERSVKRVTKRALAGHRSRSIFPILHVAVQLIDTLRVPAFRFKAWPWPGSLYAALSPLLPTEFGIISQYSLFLYIYTWWCRTLWRARSLGHQAQPRLGDTMYVRPYRHTRCSRIPCGQDCSTSDDARPKHFEHERRMTNYVAHGAQRGQTSSFVWLVELLFLNGIKILGLIQQ